MAWFLDLTIMYIQRVDVRKLFHVTRTHVLFKIFHIEYIRMVDFECVTLKPPGPDK